MSRISPALAAAVALTGLAQGAVFMVNEVTLSVSNSDNVVSSQTISLDLSSASGLTPGHPIRITLETDPTLAIPQYYWSGSFVYGAGDLDFVFEGTATLQLGTVSDSVSVNWAEQFSNLPDPGTTLANGILPANAIADPVVLEVPWGTDLSNISYIAASQSQIIGASATFGSGSFVIPQSLVTVESFVPEPGVLALAPFAFLVLLRRKRQARFAPADRAAPTPRSGSRSSGRSR